MLPDKWIIDRTPTKRFPSYTRGNAADVLADPVSPLGWTFCWESGIVIGCRDGFVTFGVFDESDYGDYSQQANLPSKIKTARQKKKDYLRLKMA